MISNLEKYKKDLDALISDGEALQCAMQKESIPEEFEKAYKKVLKGKYEEFIKKIPRFAGKYQEWYSVSLALIKKLMPDRVSDFTKLYERPKANRKEITHDNYTVEDYLFGLTVTRGWEKTTVVGPSAAIPRFEQQLNILKSVKQRFVSSLFDIKQLVQADLFDCELKAAEELNKKGFMRGAGAIAGVVLEKHLEQVSESHKLTTGKKNPGINDYNQLLKDNDIIEVKNWRFIQRLADLRNLCDHNKKDEPEKEEIEELISGVEKVTKTIF